MSRLATSLGFPESDHTMATTSQTSFLITELETVAQDLAHRSLIFPFCPMPQTAHTPHPDCSLQSSSRKLGASSTPMQSSSCSVRELHPGILSRMMRLLTILLCWYSRSPHTRADSSHSRARPVALAFGSRACAKSEALITRVLPSASRVVESREAVTKPQRMLFVFFQAVIVEDDYGVASLLQ